MDDTTAAAIVGGFFATFIVIFLIVYVLQVIGYWKMFKKFGEPGWKSIIPLYNYYIECKYCWNTKWFWIIIGIAVLSGIIAGFGEEGSTVEFLANGVGAVASIITLIETYKVSKSFGHGIGYFLGLIFLRAIFTIIIGFGKSQYVGNAGDEIPGMDYLTGSKKDEQQSEYVYAKPEEPKDENK